MDRDDRETEVARFHEHKDLRAKLEAFTRELFGKEHGDGSPFTADALALVPSDAVSAMNVYAPEHQLDDSIRDVLERSRLPEVNSIEALRLLRDAWNEHDVAAAVALFYSRMGRSMYFLQVLLNLSAVVVVVVAEEFDMIPSGPSDIDTVLFCTSMLSAFLLSVMTFANPITRWQKLRTAATQMESLIWLFRARCGPFRSKQDV